tara:strand:- start:8489 stop:8743 length:255 start_codon:yes stop_codon:yes gene_type:complete
VKVTLEVLTQSIITVKQFTEIIEDMVSKNNCSYLEALTMYAEDNTIEIESVASLVKSSHLLKAKLAAESEEVYLLKSSGAKLPL